MKICPLLLAALLGLSQCKKNDLNPVDQLPPATQTGAGTFGCLVNGQAWTPQGNNGFANYSVYYDTFSDGGLLEISTYRIDNQNNQKQFITLWTKQIHGPGTFPFRNTATATATFDDAKSGCYWASRDSTTTYRRGQLTITRLDLQAGVVSGTFAFTLHKPGCDSIRVTNGRFDRKL